MVHIFGMVKNNVFTCNNSNTYTYKKNTYKIAYDGNIYSSVIIKQELLSKGYYFETSYEEEIILKAFIEYGYDVYDKLTGHFAFVIWNECTKELIFMKDYYSIKSLYYKKLNNGDIVFSNELEKLLIFDINTIKKDIFLNTYLINFNLEDGIIIDSISESSCMMIYINKNISKIEEDNCEEYGYIFDEVAQIVLANLDNICIVKIENKQTEVYTIAKYILEMLGKEKIIITGEKSQKRIENFLTNMELPFFNIVEYKLNFMLDKIKKTALIDSEENNIKRFYNINFYENKYNSYLLLPKYAKKTIVKLEEMYYYSSEQNIEKIDYIDKEFITNKFESMLKQTKIPIYELNTTDIDYYWMIYLIRLNNWFEKYKIEIV